MESMSKFKTRKKYSSNVHKIGGAHLQCVNNHYAKFEYKEMKTVWVTDYPNLTALRMADEKNVLVQHP